LPSPWLSLFSPKTLVGGDPLPVTLPRFYRLILGGNYNFSIGVTGEFTLSVLFIEFKSKGAVISVVLMEELPWTKLTFSILRPELIE